GSNGVLEIEEDHVGGGFRGLLEELRLAARHRQLAAVEARGGRLDDLEAHGVLRCIEVPFMPIDVPAGKDSPRSHEGHGSTQSAGALWWTSSSRPTQTRRDSDLRLALPMRLDPAKRPPPLAGRGQVQGEAAGVPRNSVLFLRLSMSFPRKR